MTTKSQVQTASSTNALIGIWLIIAPFALAYFHTASAVWNDIIVGAVILLAAGARAAAPSSNVGLSWLNVVLGAWLVIAPFALGNGAITANVWNDAVVGLAVVCLAAWSAVAGQRLHGGGGMHPAAG